MPFTSPALQGTTRRARCIELCERDDARLPLCGSEDLLTWFFLRKHAHTMCGGDSCSSKQLLEVWKTCQATELIERFNVLGDRNDASSRHNERFNLSGAS